MVGLNHEQTDLALQLFTVHKELNTDPRNTLDWVAAAGFESVEVAGFSYLGAKKFAEELAMRQISCIGIHGPCVEAYGRERLTDLVSWFERMREYFDCSSAVVFRDPESFSYDEATPGSEEKHYRELTGLIGELNDRLEAVHINLAFHCYDVDLLPFRSRPSGEQQCGLKMLLDGIPSDNFSLQLDTYFLARAIMDFGATSLSVSELARGRVSSVHVNDIYETGRSAPIGAGVALLAELVMGISEQNECLRWILELDPRTGDAATRRQAIIDSKGYWEQNANSWLSRGR